MPVNTNKPLRVRMHKTVELQPYHLRALKYHYGCTTHSNVRRWLEVSGTYRLEDLPEKTQEEWDKEGWNDEGELS